MGAGSPFSSVAWRSGGVYARGWVLDPVRCYAIPASRRDGFVDGVSNGLNKGLVGAESDSARGTWDNFTVQVLPPQLTLDEVEDFNDGVANENIDFLVMCYQALGERRLLDPIARGMNAFVALQRPAPQAGWVLQYTPDGEPAGARTYEPKAVVTADMDLFSVAKQFLDTNFAVLPVVENGKPVGRISRQDMLRGIQQMQRDFQREKSRKPSGANG